jgi:hypothetical protein
MGQGRKAAMNDKETLLAMFERAGIVPEFPTGGNGGKYTDVVTVNADRRDESPQDGYHGRYTDFSFHPDGSLAQIGAWE